MTKILFTVFASASLLFLNLFQPGDVSIQVDVPDMVTAGTEFEVQLTLSKGDLESFSRFQMDIPAGLTASSYLTPNGDFTFKDKRVRLIWLRLPEDEVFTVIYKVNVDERLKGTFSLDGKFSYIANNERKSVTVNTNSINILPSPTIDPNLIVDINEFEDKVIDYIPTASASSENIACIRQAPFPNNSGNEFIVNVLVNKENKKKFAKIEEQIPSGYKAFALESKNAIFTFKDNVSKFLWMNMPPDPYFIVSYRLIPIQGRKQESLNIQGQFSFLEEEKTVNIEIVQKNVKLSTLDREEILALVNEVKSQPVATTDEQLLAIQNNTKTISQTSIDTKNSYSSDRKSYLLEPEPGIYYRIQIAAGHNPVNIKRYFRKFRLNKEVRKEEHEGWIKYSVGSFNVYKDARDYRVHIWNTSEIDDAFVAAYNNGTRITVQEALMIADQKWYR